MTTKFVRMMAVATVLVGGLAHAADSRPTMRQMPVARRAPERVQRVPVAAAPQASSRSSYRTSMPSVGCLSGDCALARARAEHEARTGTRADAMARLNEKYRQREVQRQEERAAIRARFENQNIDARR
jgi:hypothetical protein